MHAQHLGNEPLEARSALHLRFILATFGAVVLTFAALYAFTRSDPATEVVLLGGISAVFAVIALIDMSVIRARLKGDDTPHSGPQNRS